MKIENIMKMLEVFWPIAIAIYGFFIYKFIPYMKTKIFINEYHNFEESFFLMEYELVGTIVAQVLVIFLIVAFIKYHTPVLISRTFLHFPFKHQKQ